MESSIQDKLMQQLHQNFHFMMEIHHKAMGKEDKQHGGQHILKALYKNGAMNKADIQNKMRHASTEIEESCRELQEKGLITKSGEGDSAKIELTEAGRKKVDEIIRHKKELGDKVFGALSADDQQKLSDIMEKLNASMRKLAGGDAQNGHDMEDCPNCGCGCDQKR